jgi:O-antigen biosynthesis protein
VHRDIPPELPVPGSDSRLIEWTGERCVPWAPDKRVVCEHLHRYLWAEQVVRGKRVLDLGCGEGYGSAILGRSAEAVIGVDIDRDTIEHATSNYGAPRVEFQVADARDLAPLADDSFDVVVGFEMIEHIGEQQPVLSEVGRVLRADGLLILSTPNRDVYNAEREEPNPFHVTELSKEEFRTLLSGSFEHTAIWEQRTFSGSVVTSEQEGQATGSRSEFVEIDLEGWKAVAAPEPPYLIGLASHAELPGLPSQSLLSDPRDGLSDVQGLTRQNTELRRALRDHREELAELRLRAARDAHTIAALDSAITDASKRLRRVEASVTWQLFLKVRSGLFGLLGGEDSRAVGAVQAVLRLLGRAARTTTGRGRSTENMIQRARRKAGTGPVELQRSESPTASIVIPLYSHSELTRVALESIRDNTAHIPYEVILVDDSADPATKELLAQVQGANVLVNTENIGYLRSITRGVAAARGRWIVLCNNDIEVEPGWLAALLEAGQSGHDVAIVSPKFLYPDGSLAEAGAVIWRDGTGANYGRRDDPACCHYEFRRTVDYGSAAALLVRRDVWDEIGGFDERFLPMYYEDSDLCFEARSRGYRVLYEPRARVVHVEGATAGVDEKSGHKRAQEVNRPKFVEKWRGVLEAEHLPNDQGHLWLGANLRRRPHVLIGDHRVPTWDRDSGGLRMRGIIDALLELGCHVVLLPDNLSAIQPHTRELQRLGVEVLYDINPDDALAKIGPSLSLAILSRPLVAERWLRRLRTFAPGAKILYDTVDLHWLREARRGAAGIRNGSGRSIGPATVDGWRQLEVGLVRQADATLVVTEEERGHVLADVPDADVYVVPNINPLRASVPPRAGRQGLLFIGGFEHTPNVDAALTLVRDVMPLVWSELPDIPVTIVGADPPPEIEELRSALVEVTGWVRDLDPLLDSSIAMVAPLRYGAGMKGKVTQSLAAGLPVVTTAIGAEGLGAINGEHVLTGESSEELAAQILRLLGDPVMWQKLSRQGQELLESTCSPQLVAERIRELVALASNRSGLREADRGQPATLLDA